MVLGRFYPDGNELPRSLPLFLACPQHSGPYYGRRSGHESCLPVVHMAKRFQEIVAWQLADELRRQVVSATATAAFYGELRLRAQLRSAANSASANIAEGFKRFNPREFAQFLKYSRGSLAELGVHLTDARDRQLITAVQHASLSHLAARAAIACARLHAHLRTAKAPKPREPL